MHTVPFLCDAKIVSARWRAYRIRLRRPWHSAHGMRTERGGYLVRMETAEGLTGYGECAPLFEAGTETDRQTRRVLSELLPDCPGRSPQAVSGLLSRASGAPAARCGIETALLDLVARVEQAPLYRHLSADASGRIRVNAALGGLDTGIGARMRGAVDRGFRVLKIKLGIYALADELKRLRSLCRQLPQGVVLRLDANRAWNPDQAQRALRVLIDLPVESLEEPLNRFAGDELRALQAQVPWPLALDESCVEMDRDRLLKNAPVRRLVLKPTALGGLLPGLEIARSAAAVGMECVVTSALESATGLWAAAHLAAALKNDLAHGLDTARWLQDPGDAPCARNGALAIPQLAGLGWVPTRDSDDR